MVLSWTRGRVFRRARKGKDLQVNDLEVEISVPSHFRCPVSLDLMKDPVTVSTGITYDRDSIEKWIEEGNNTCPVTKRVLTTFDMIPNHALRRMIQDWCVEHRSFGIERIPTPRIPITPYEVSDTCAKIVNAAKKGDESKCRELVRKIKGWEKESDRNKRCIVANGASLALVNAFDFFSSLAFEENNNVSSLLEEILGVLAWMRPMSEEVKSMLGSKSSMSCMVWFLLKGNIDLSIKQSVAMLLKEVPTEVLANTQGVAEGLVKMIKEPIGSASITKACLSMIFKLVTYSKGKDVLSQRFVELDLVEVLLEIIVDCEKGVCEKALGVLDSICGTKQGKEIAKNNALTIPLVVKKLLRVSELSSCFAVSIIWKICDKEAQEEEEGVFVEAVQVGVFQKLLVLLQVGCGESTKEKATELLKLLNGYRSKVDCVDSSSLELQHLKKPF
ncbi:hypothetical protein PIB30_060272 [Stylosanthes scabra]|uniref:U-box domain-containing protein n=1 Tax=Stylosanthes scabra TaxID=79078 RepID=A0ABU6SLD5_9FABA|nr:hypothetical protein [Stylosanthes scabra]